MKLQQIGVAGMAVMGRNLAMNLLNNGYSVSVYNRSWGRVESILEANPTKDLFGTTSIEEFVQSIERPRKIILMIAAGKPTDLTIDALLPHLDEGDILIDGGNTYFRDTIARNARLADSGINFIGTGVSGGEEGALNGPAIMPGGQKEAYDLVAPILETIAAKAPDGEPCVTYIGADGAGHYVKMIHNGIEYGDMQLIAETYDLMHRVLGYSPQTMSEIFAEWNQGELASYLIEITADILAAIDPKTDQPMVDMILDAAGNKGTGKWTSQDALDLGEPLTLITESVYARFISAQKEQRVQASQHLTYTSTVPTLNEEQKEQIVADLRQALYFAKIISYAQGFAQMRAASQAYDWDLNYGNIAKIFRAGCIIRADFLQEISQAYAKNPDLENLLLDEYFLKTVNDSQDSVRRIVKLAIDAGIPTPTFSAALNYFDSYRSAVLPANLIQAQRDYFGAHTYERTDEEGIFHFLWDQAKEVRQD